jgi:hypothetical protein
MGQAGYEIAAPDVIAESLDGEVLIVNLATGVYFRGDSNAAQAWTMVTSGSAPGSGEASNTPAIAAFVAELLAEGLIRERSVAAESPAEGPAPIPSGPFQLEKFEDLQDMLALDPIHDVDPNTGWPQPR